MNELIQKLNSNDESERIYAAQDIGETKNPAMADALLKRLLIESSQLVKDAIVFSLMNMPCHQIFDGLFNLFSSTDAFLRNAAVSIFGAMKNEATPFLTYHLDHANREVRKLILDALYAIGTPEAIQAIRAGLYDTAVNVQITAVEYLGILEDTKSTGELIRLLDRKNEPMLRCAILESLACIGESGTIQRVMEVLAQNDNINSIDPIYIPGVIKLAAQAGDLNFICKVFEEIDDLTTFADDIIRAVSETRRRFDNILEECCIVEMIISMIKNTHLHEKVRYSAVEIVLTADKDILTDAELFSLGNELIAEPSMIYAGVRVLDRSNHPEAKKIMFDIIKTTKDEELRSLCEELLSIQQEISRR